MVTLCGWRGRLCLLGAMGLLWLFASCLWPQLLCVVPLPSLFFFCILLLSFLVAVQQSDFQLCDAVVVEIFSGFSGAAGPRLFTIHQIDASTNNLPKAHTW